MISKLREAEVLLAQGKKVGEICHFVGVMEQKNDRWRIHDSGLEID